MYFIETRQLGLEQESAKFGNATKKGLSWVPEEFFFSRSKRTLSDSTGCPDSEGKNIIRICMGISITNWKRYLHAKVLNKKAAFYCPGDFLAFCVAMEATSQIPGLSLVPK